MSQKTTLRRAASFITVAVACLAVTLLVAAGGGNGQSAPPAAKPSPATEGSPKVSTPPSWKTIDKLIDEEKLSEAAEGVAAIREAASKAGNTEEWTRALVKETQLRIALHGYETAVRHLKEQPWPQDEWARATLNLFYAHSLVTYAESYGWEIRQREKVVSSQEVDLKAWTMEEIHLAAVRAYLEVWERRERLATEPTNRWFEYIRPNNYPAEVRGTLRDAVTYLFVELLADTSFWRPEHESETFALDLGSLLTPRDDAARTVKLDDPAIHPLVRICAILDDHERWAGRVGRLEAQLEARLERTRRLRDAFADEEDRRTIRADLEKRLPAFRKLPWWAAGMAQLATLVKAEDAPDSLVRARDLARQGERAYPDTKGGIHCRSIAEHLEAPDYSLLGLNADGSGKRSLGVEHRNLSELHFRAYRMDAVRFAAESRDWSLRPDSNEIRALVQSGSPAARWSVDLPPTPDLRSHRTFVTPAVQERGFYIIVASARPSFDREDNLMLALPFSVTDMVVLRRDDGKGGQEMRVVAAETGTPLPGVSLHLYQRNWRDGHTRTKTLVTDTAGLATFESTDTRRSASHFLVAERPGEVLLDDRHLGFSNPPESRQITASFLYTDRSVYRPQQKVLFKVVGYTGNREEGSFEVARNRPVRVTLYDPNGDEVAALDLSTNTYGTASGELVIPGGRPLGSWQLHSSLDGRTSLRVEEYKRPTFEVTMADPEDALRLNREAVLKGEARYYFGLPVTAGAVRWRVTREPVYPWWWGWWWGRPVNTSAQKVASGESRLAEDGTFDVRFVPAADERLAQSSKETTYRFRIEADVTDEGGETRSTSRSFRLGFVDVEASIDLAGGFMMAGAPARAVITRRSLDGVPRAGSGSWELVELVQPAAAVMPADEDVPIEESRAQYATPGDRQKPRWAPDYRPERTLRGWPAGRRVGAGSCEHDAAGKAHLELPALSGGAYRLTYTTQDEFGATYETTRELLVASPALSLALPLVVRAEADSVRVGGTARLLVHSGIPGQTLYVDRFRDGKLLDRRQLVAGRDGAVVELPIREQDRGGFTCLVVAVRDHQVLTQSVAISVPWDDRQLDVTFATFRDRMRPKSRETWRVQVKTSDGRPAEVGAAELLAYMYDRSLDIFAPHTPPQPLSIYPLRMQPVSVQPNLALAHGERFDDSSFRPTTLPPILRSDELVFHSEYGVGGLGIRRKMALRAVSAVPEAMPAPMAAEASMSSEVQGGVVGGVPGGGLGDASDSRLLPVETPPEAPAAELRSDFAETAFWEPHLLTGQDGTASIEFTVPDSVTSWNVWVHAVTRDLRAGVLHTEARSVKDLMVRPYVPRFLREGDRAILKVVVNNAGETDLSGRLALDILDPETNRSLLAEFGLEPGQAVRPFSVRPGGGADLAFAITVPRRVGQVAFKVVASAGDLSDGELRPLPLLPSRMHLAQSRFVTLRDADRRVMRFDDLARHDDPTMLNERLVVTVDAQLFYQVLAALPYLVNYPYECTEQTLNRFLSTGIVASVFEDYPAVARMAEQMARRDTVLETFDQADPNRRMALEETPWLVQARGGKDAGEGFVNVLDPRVARANRDQAMAKLRKAQTAIGGFPWWEGGPPSPFMTLYLMHGFAKAAEFGIEVPKDMVQRGWQYLAKHYRETWRGMMKDDCCWEALTFLDYVATAYPDESWTGDALTLDERKEILDYSFRHWKRHSPYLKGYLALTLARMDRPSDAKLVWDSVMDSAKTTQDEGTFWAPEDRSWLWYNDTIESHAFALRTLMELAPQDARRHGLVQWLLLNKKLNQWKSTRATAEVIYALVHYLKAEKMLGIKENLTVSVGPQTTTFVFDPDRYEGRKNQLVIPGEKVGPTTAEVTVEKTSPGFAFASATWHFSTERLPDAERGDFFQVSRRYFKREMTGREWVLRPLAEGETLAIGDQIEVQISLRSKHEAEYVHLRDPRAAGLEPEDPRSGFKWNLGLGWYEEVRDSGANFFFESLPVGECTFKYRLRANMAGTFRIGPATVQSMYAPEFAAYSTGHVMEVKAAE
ncbi:MAG TPA: alpha-2-macroglobulin family protein [Thermoanaerobaculaceae bacterium]|nr:alpha-2-macroglobulin family protein [Thermoanaerobaculaceae bacterium]HRS15193.1 alpha-2-macroglobulin family protein [Thermoanaerobaculaceae bacterium]